MVLTQGVCTIERSTSNTLANNSSTDSTMAVHYNYLSHLLDVQQDSTKKYICVNTRVLSLIVLITLIGTSFTRGSGYHNWNTDTFFSNCTIRESVILPLPWSYSWKTTSPCNRKLFAKELVIVTPPK